MKFRFAVFVALASLAFLLAACNFTMAADVTPPPDYIPPTPAATLGPLYPAQAPSTKNGALIFVEKCAACHGDTGLGDGEQGIQLGVTVPAFGLPEIARPASLAQWYTVVTQGNMERFMPPFASLSDQERWDVVAYAMTLHTTEAELEQGRQLFEANCANCPLEFFMDQTRMSELSEVELARIVRQGNDEIPAFGADLTDEEMWSVAAYLRTLSFDTSPVVAAPEVTATAQPEGTVTGTEQAQATSEVTAVAQSGLGPVSGIIENRTGEELPSDLTVTLRGYDHGADPSMGAQQVFTREARVDSEGSFVFENIEIPANRIFLAEITYDGVALQSGYAIVNEGDSEVSLPALQVYRKTEDTSRLVIDETRIFLEYGTDNVQIFEVYTFRNPGDEIVVVELSENGEIPFMKLPEGVSGVGYEPMQDSETFQYTGDGLAIPPSEGSYGMIAFASLPKARELELRQEFVLPTSLVTVFVPEGVSIETARSTDLGVQAIQDFNFQIYELGAVNAGEQLEFTVAGTPRDSGAASSSTQTGTNQNLLIGAGALGVALILAGAWMYLRDRNHADDEAGETETDEFKSSEEVIDAIIALDDLHRARKISDEAYQKRRAELKGILKEKM
ncbi:MAG TPA: c-type cytochrome [Anaerolineales bacterium]|nr:c-type cytochrome [Anaerolineales bacterium]